MRLLRALWRFLTGVRDRVVWIVVGVLGPPVAALRRLLAALRDRFDGLIGTVLEWWSRVFAPVSKLPSQETAPPAACCLLAAAAVLGLAVFTWRQERYLEAREFMSLCVGLWLPTFLVARYVSRPDSQERRGALVA